MKLFIQISLLSLLISLFMIACSDGTDVVESGTYQGTIDKVEAEETEIYVKTDDGKILELYFTENTQVMNNEMPAQFSDLKEGQNVEVKVEKKGKRLDPLTVKILEK